MARIEATVVCQGHAEISGTNNTHAMNHIEAQDFTQMSLQFGNAVTYAADTELSKVGEVLSNLCRVQLKLFGERLR
jgi:hypothetical protein